MISILLISASGSASSGSAGSEQEEFEKEDNLVAFIIRRKALKYREKYNSLGANDKGIVSLGLNSILDISFDFPGCQSKLFKNQEWLGLRRLYQPITYDTGEYDRIKSILQPVFNAYRSSKTFDVNRMKMYKEAKKLEKHYDNVLDSEHADVSFCASLIMRVLLTIRYNAELSDAAVDSSEWDFIVKF